MLGMFSDNRLDFLPGSQISEQFPRRIMELLELDSPFLDLKLPFEKLSSTVNNKKALKNALKNEE